MLPGETDLRLLLKGLKPTVGDEDIVFLCRPGAAYGDHAALQPLAVFREAEGLTLLVPRAAALAAGLPEAEETANAFRCITLAVESSLEAVGLTAAVARVLADAHIPANVVAAYHHDHVFVPAGRADEAVRILQALSQ